MITMQNAKMPSLADKLLAEEKARLAEEAREKAKAKAERAKRVKKGRKVSSKKKSK